MFTLIKREIEDHVVYFIGAIILSGIITALLVSFVFNDEKGMRPLFIWLSIPVVVVLIIGFPAMGASQMYTDKNRKVTAFLSALPVTRGQILTTRIITGILAILILFLPLIITTAVLHNLFAPTIPIYTDIISDIFIVAFLTAFACYCIGLLTGWTSSKIIPTLGAIVLTCIIVTLILVKGFGPDIKFILILFIAATLIRTWQKFNSTAL